jgi:hypothetical protein
MQTMSLNQLGMDGVSSKQAPVVVIVASSTGKLVEGLHIGMIERALRRLKVYQGSTLGAQIIQGGPEQPVKFSRVPRNCFQNYSGCYKISQAGGCRPRPQARC